MENKATASRAPRTALMKELDALSQKRIVYIHAPAGYGKSFSVRMWLERISYPHAWVSVNEFIGRKPVEFCERLVLTLLMLQPKNTALKEIATHESFAISPFKFLRRALNAFSTFNLFELGGQKNVIVIDDIHLLTNAAMLNRLSELIYELPEKVTLFILSRTKPSQSFSEFIVKDQATVLDVDMLKFSESEIKSFFASRSRKLTSQQVQEILAMTGGWAIGLNALLLSSNGNLKYNIHNLQSKYLNTFIKKHIWEKWDDNRRNFLLRVSVADELTPAFCNAMSGRKDSAEILDGLVRENAFISVSGNVYRFHHLFQDFLEHILVNENKELRKKLFREAGDWFYGAADYYKAVEYYIECGDKKGIMKGLKLMYNYNSPYASIEDTADIIRRSVDDSLLEEYPFLLETVIWADFVEGCGTEFERRLNNYYKVFPKNILQNPLSILLLIMLRVLDYRNSWADITKTLNNFPFKSLAGAPTPSVSQNLPFFHRSYRDFSEYMIETDKHKKQFVNAVTALFGQEGVVMIDCIYAGFHYEKGDFDKAHQYAITANANVTDEFAPEIKFCAQMILAAVLDAQNDRDGAQRILEIAERMIERNKAFYLYMNLQSYQFRLQFQDGNEESAQDWLKNYASDPYAVPVFYKLHQHFTTVRAYIVMQDYNTAILFAKKLLVLCEQYHRPLDCIEANILLAISYWKKGRNEAFVPLEQAIISAQKYGYTQVFANEGAELSTMLHKLQKRIAQKDYTGELLTAQLKIIYIMVLERAKFSRGLTRGKVKENIKFTERQKEVMKYLCEGLTHKAIGEKMGLKPSAVKSHMILIYKKLDVSNGVDAIIKIRALDVLESG